MTYPAGAGVITAVYGPSVPTTAAGQGAAAPFTATPGAAANVAQTVPAAPTFNFAHTISSTQELLNGTLENVTQQGTRYNVNASSVTLAGLKAGRDQTYYTGLDTGSLNG